MATTDFVKPQEERLTEEQRPERSPTRSHREAKRCSGEHAENEPCSRHGKGHKRRNEEDRWKRIEDSPFPLKCFSGTGYVVRIIAGNNGARCVP
jgi:hypothetical protein